MTSSRVQSALTSLRVGVGPLKRSPSNPSLAEAVDGLKKGKNVRFPGLLDERIEECGPNRNCYEAVKRERNASKPPLEEFLSRFLGT